MFKKLMLTAMVVLASAGLGSNVSAQGQGGNLDCPAGSVLLAKYNWNGNAYVAESGGNVVTVSGNATSGTFTVTDPTKEVTAVIVKASDDAKVDTYNPGVTSGSFNNSGITNNGGQTPDISNVKFCGGNKRQPVTPQTPPPAPTPTPTPNPVTHGSTLGTSTAQGGSGAQADSPAGGVTSGFGGAAGSITGSLIGLGGSLAALGLGIRRLSKSE